MTQKLAASSAHLLVITFRSFRTTLFIGTAWQMPNYYWLGKHSY